MDPCVRDSEITEALEKAKSAHKRIDDHNERMNKMDDNNKILHEMNTNLKLMVQQNEQRDIKVEGIEKDVKDIKDKPHETFNRIKWIFITVFCTAFATAIIMSMPTIVSNLIN